MTTTSPIEAFLDGSPFAVIGASHRRRKYGNKVLRCYLQNGRLAYPVNPNLETVEGRACYPNLTALTEHTPIHAASIITPSRITEQVVEEAGRLGIQHLWMQPGAESDHAIQRAVELGINVIAGGPCILVVMGYDDTWSDWTEA